MEKIIEFLNNKKLRTLIGFLIGLIGVSLLINAVIISYSLSLYPEMFGFTILWGMLLEGLLFALLGFSVSFIKDEKVQTALIRVVLFVGIIHVLVFTVASIVDEIDSLKYLLANPIDVSDLQNE